MNNYYFIPFYRFCWFKSKLNFGFNIAVLLQVAWPAELNEPWIYEIYARIFLMLV